MCDSQLQLDEKIPNVIQWPQLQLELEVPTLSSTDLRNKSKVSHFKLVTHMIRMCVFEWCVVRCGSRMDTKKCVFLIGLHAQNLLTILGSIINIVGGEWEPM